MRLSRAHHFLLMLVSVAICSGGAGCSNKQKTTRAKQPRQAAKQKTPPKEIPVTPAGQLDLAIKYFTGEGKTQNHEKAVKYFKMAADNGSHEAQFALGCMYQNGHGVAQNFMEATNWYLKAAQADNPNAQFLLGLSYKEGSGVPRDPLECYKWIYLAAEAGNTLHIATRQQLEQAYSPPMINEGRRRADQFRLYQGVNN